MSSPRYGQVVLGPPGSGKTTYCNGMQQYLRLLGRDAWVINLDPANEVGSAEAAAETTTSDTNDKDQEQEEEQGGLPYETLFDVCEEVVSLSSVMEQTGLGPNGGLVYCMEYLEAHVDDVLGILQERLALAKHSKSYLLFDLPGQVELYTHSICVQKLLHRLVKDLDLRLAAVQLVDAHYCTDATKFISAALLGTTTMLRLELPTVNVLSKVDLLSNYGDLPFSLEFFTECHDLDRLLPFLDHQNHANLLANGNNNTQQQQDEEDEFAIADDPDYQRARQKRRNSKFFRKHAKLHEALAEVVEDFGLLSFIPLDISSAESVGRVLARVDKCNGYIFTTEGGGASSSSVNYEDLFQCAIRSDRTYDHIADVQERLAAPESIPELNKNR